MKWSFATIGIILLGLIGVSIILLFQQITTNNENDYYLLKEITEAAMIDSIDIGYYRDTGDLKIVREKFVENFTRRFAESTIFVTNDYNIEFYDIMELPPKVSIIVDTGLGEYTVGGNAAEYGIANKLDAILEYTGDKTYKPSSVNPYDLHCTGCIGNEPLTETYYAILSNGVTSLSLKTPDILNAPNIKDIKIESVKYDGVATGQGEVNLALLKNEITYNNVVTNYMQSSSEFTDTINNVNINYHNCSDSKVGYNCDDINKYYVSISGNFSGKVILKYNVTWSYKEYKFS